MTASPQDRCHVNGVCVLDSTCPRRFECVQEADASLRHPEDPPVMGLESMLGLCQLAKWCAGFVLGMFLGGLFVATFHTELTALYWAAQTLWF